MYWLCDVLNRVGKRKIRCGRNDFHWDKNMQKQRSNHSVTAQGVKTGKRSKHLSFWVIYYTSYFKTIWKKWLEFYKHAEVFLQGKKFTLFQLNDFMHYLKGRMRMPSIAWESVWVQVLLGTVNLSSAVFISAAVFPQRSLRLTHFGRPTLDQTNHLSAHFYTWPLLLNTPNIPPSAPHSTCNCRSEERRVGKERSTRWSPDH